MIGLGLAGLSFAETLRLEGKSVHVIDSKKSGSSAIAAGIYNPTVLKRFNLSWNGVKFHETALPFYQSIEKRLNQNLLRPLPIHKIFIEAADRNQWTVATDREGLDFFLDSKIKNDQHQGIKTPYGYGTVKHCGRLDTATLIETYKSALGNDYQQENFDYHALEIFDDSIRYKSIEASHIVFCEGYAMVDNPFFSYLPLIGSKGQILLIRSSQLSSKMILKGPIFIAPLHDDLFWAGASFEQQDKSLQTTEEGKDWVLRKIHQMIEVPFTVEEQIAQIRPTVKDRRPLLGTHSSSRRIHLLNGFGSRGVLTAPLASRWLFNAIFKNESLPDEVNISRFEKKA